MFYTIMILGIIYSTLLRHSIFIYILLLLYISKFHFIYI